MLTKTCCVNFFGINTVGDDSMVVDTNNHIAAMVVDNLLSENNVDLENNGTLTPVITNNGTMNTVFIQLSQDVDTCTPLSFPPPPPHPPT